MGLTSSLQTGLTGLAANSTMIDVTGNNIANVNTNAFKASRVSFETQIAETRRSGSAPSAELGGTNPAQVGRGVNVAAITADFSGGAISVTGNNTDLAIEGDGFFVVDDAGAQRFTRNGNFTLDRDFNLTTASGGRIQGFGVDEDGEVVPGVLQDMQVPVGVTTLAEATTEVKFTGNLNAGGEVATQGSITQLETLYDDAGATNTAGPTSSLTGVFKADGTQPFATGDVITITGATRGGATVPDRTFEVGTDTADADASGSTLGDFAAFLQDIFGLDPDATIPAGVDVTAGNLAITSNVGTANAINLQGSNLVVNFGNSPSAPLGTTRTQDATGESTLTTFAAFDSLGNPLTVNLTTVLTGKDSDGTTWDFFATAEDDTDLGTFLGTGTSRFDTDGQLIGLTDNILNLDRADTGAVNPLAINLEFTDPFGSVTALVDSASQLRSLSQDGSAIGSLQDFTVGLDGTITGAFTNGLNRTLGRIPVATFANNQGLRQVGSSLFATENNSGNPVVSTAGTSGAGTLLAGSLELSNVELSEEFVNLITASTGFSAASRVITTSDELIQELLAAVR